ncbi:MAG: metal-dependent transcriptional regulator [Candidatus Woesearchaeota archaeon]
MHLDLHANHRLAIAREMYIKAIYELSLQQSSIKQTDIVDCLQVSKSTVHEMLKKLEDEGLVTIDTYVQLTTLGTQQAQLVVKKYTILKTFIDAHLHMKDAHDEACHIEHACSLDFVEALQKYMKKHAHCKRK